MPGKLPSLAISAALHFGAFFALIYAPSLSLPSLPPPSPSEYQQAFAGKEDKIVWYRFRELPKISPQSTPRARQPMRADVISKQAIVSSPKSAPKRNQVVLTPLPKMELPALELPNLLAVKLPPKQFTTPPNLVRRAPSKIDTPDAPDPAAAPQLETARLPIAKLPPKPYVPPQPRVAPQPRRIGAATEVPSIAAELKQADVPAVKLPPRAFVPPQPAPPPARQTPVVALPAEVTIAIAGLTPTTNPVKLPPASSPAQFAAGQTLRSSGATTDGDGKGIVVPDLYAAAPKKTDLLALVTAAPGSKAFRPMASGEATLPSVSSHPMATRVSNAPDRRFNGRDVYMMAIQMSNLTSYSGSWLMWYAARTERGPNLPPIEAPVPYRKVDPKYLPSAISDHVEGKVQLFCVIGREGTVSSIELLRGADDRLNKSAEEALSKWEFYPATRNGQPVDVDVVVEIPFTVGPTPK